MKRKVGPLWSLEEGQRMGRFWKRVLRNCASPRGWAPAYSDDPYTSCAICGSTGVLAVHGSTVCAPCKNRVSEPREYQQFYGGPVSVNPGRQERPARKVVEL
jgi:hypothetical protein